MGFLRGRVVVVGRGRRRRNVAVGGEFAACVYGFGGEGVVGYEAGAFAVGGCVTGCDLWERRRGFFFSIIFSSSSFLER